MDNRKVFFANKGHLLADELYLQPKVKSIQLWGYKIDDIPENLLSFFPNLSILYMRGGQFNGDDKLLPDDFFAPVQLSSLNINSYKLSALPTSLSLNKKLTNIQIAHNALTEIPPYFRDFKALQDLDLQDNRLSFLPDWLTELSDLATLRITKNKIMALPPHLERLTKLRTLDALCEGLSPQPELLIACPKLYTCRMSWQTDKIYHLLYRFLRLSATFGWTLADKLLMWQIYTNKESASKATLKALFEVLYSRDIRFTHFVLAEISRRYKTSAKPLVKGSKVAINGLIPLERRVLKALLKGATLTFHAQILPSTTHIICATLPAVDYTRLHTANLLTINDFFEFVNWEKSGYIAQADEAENRVMAENLSALFLSGQAENVALALELIANGGLPKQSLITPLFLVAKDDFFAPELRQRCRELLFSQASFELQAKMRYKIRLFRRYLHKKDERLRRIAAYAPYPELDIAIIEDYMRRRLGKYF